MAAILLLAAASANAEPRRQPPDAYENVSSLLADARDESAITLFTGVPPYGCVPVSQSTRLCGWKLGDRDPGWKSLAKAIDTRSRVALLCELPLDGSERAPNACGATPAKTNKTSFGVVQSKKTGAAKRRNSKSVQAELRAEYKSIATAWIDEARTLVELSRMMGAIPNACTRIDEETQSCVWRANNHSYGHGTVVTWIGAPQRQKVRMTCVVPLDGGGRRPDSCHAEAGS